MSKDINLEDTQSIVKFNENKKQWVLPGGELTHNVTDAVKVARKMDKLIKDNGGVNVPSNRQYDS